MPNEVEITITGRDISDPAFISARGHMKELRAEAKGLAEDMKRVGSPHINLADMRSGLTQMKSMIQSIGIADIADANLTPGRIMAQLLMMKRLINQAGIKDLLDFNVDEGALTSQLAKIGRITETIPINFRLGPFPNLPSGESIKITPDVKLTTLPAVLANIAAQAAIADGSLMHMAFGVTQLNRITAAATAQNRIFDGSLMNAAFAATAAQRSFVNMATGLGSVGSTADQVGADLYGLGKAADDAMGSGSGRGGGRGFRGLAGAFFGGAAAGKAFGAGIGWMTHIGGILGGVTAWHIVLDALIEGFIIAAGTAIALGAGFLALAPTAQDVYTHLKAVQTVSSALGQNIPPLNGQISTLQSSFASKGIEIYGGALNIVNSRTGAFSRIMSPVVNLFDTWIAKINIWSQSAGPMNKLMNTSVGFLSQMGHFLGEVGIGFGNLLKADPGTAHFLLDLVGGLGSIFAFVTKLPTPILLTAIALHSMYVWGNLLGEAIGRLGLGLITLPARLAALATNPFTWVVVAAAGIAYMIYEMNQASPAAKSFIGSIESSLSNATASQAIYQIVISIGQLHAAIGLAKFQNIRTVGDWLNQFGEDVRHAATPFRLAGDLWDAFTSKFSGGSNKDIQVYTGEITHLSNEQKNLFMTLGWLDKGGRSFSQSLALMDLAGVKVNDSFAVMQQKIKDLITGYQNLGVNGGLLSNAVNAVTFQALQQQSQIAALNAGWDAFFKTVIGGSTGFIAYAQNFHTLGVDIGIAHVSMNGLNGVSITARNQFLSTAQAAQTEMDNLTTMAAAAGGGADKTALLTQAAKDMVAGMLPAAKGSKALTDILYALAQQGGYRGADSFKALSQWVGKTHDPMKNLDKIVTILTGDSANLINDVKNLSTALGTTLNDAMATAIFQATGGQRVFDNFATAVMNAHGHVDKMVPSAIALGQALYTQLGGNVNATKSEFYSFAEFGLRLTRSEADALWQDIRNNLDPALNSMPAFKTSDIHISGTGQWSISPNAQLPGGTAGARGLMVRGGQHGKDSVPLMGMPGELMVPDWMVNAGYVDHLRGMIPGFAGGGVVGSYSRSGSAGVRGVGPWGDHEWNLTQSAIMQATANAMVAHIKSMNPPLPGFPSGTSSTGLYSIARYAMQHGATRAAAAGIGGTVAGESMGNPEAIQAGGGGGMGIIQWTPGSSAFPYQPIITGNPGRDMAVQLVDMLYYINSRGGMGAINAAGSAGPMAAAWVFSNMLAPLVPGSDIVPSIVDILYGAGYDKGGWLPTGLSLAYNGTGAPEPVGAAGKATVVIQIAGTGNLTFDALMLQWIRNNVRILGGGDVQTAFGGTQGNIW